MEKQTAHTHTYTHRQTHENFTMNSSSYFRSIRKEGMLKTGEEFEFSEEFETAIPVCMWPEAAKPTESMFMLCRNNSSVSSRFI
jgi:hypothetical protein